MRLFLPILLVAALIVPTLHAQRPAARKRAPAKPAPAAPARDAWTLSTVRVSGNRNFSADAIAQATGLQLGATVSVADLKQAVQRLTDTGAFETLSYKYTTEGEKIVVTFDVQEVLDLYPVGFDRVDMPDADLLQALGERVPLFGRQIPATGAMVKRIVEALESLLETKMVGRLLTTPDGRLVMTFRPAEPPPVITFVKFEGSAILRAEDLQKAFYQVSVGSPYTETRLREMLDATIRPLFEEKGRLQVRFGPFRTEPSTEPSGVQVTVLVEDGEEFLFGTAVFRGATSIPEKDLSRLIKLEEGELANFALVNQGLAAIERRYQREGYMKVKAAAERTINQKPKTVDLVIAIREGDRYNLRNLEIKGLDINAAAAVRKRWAIQRGQPFDGSYPERFLKQIEEEGMFERLAKTAFRVTVDEAAKMVDVELEFKAEAVKPRVVR